RAFVFRGTDCGNQIETRRAAFLPFQFFQIVYSESGRSGTLAHSANQENMMAEHGPSGQISRRGWLGRAACGAGTVALAGMCRPGRARGDETPVASNRRIQQSLVHWCYKSAWPDVEELCRIAVKLGCPSIELIDPAHWPT